MNTTITQVSPAEYDLTINMPAEELRGDLDQAIRTQRARTQLKGFRPGKVPTAMVKKMYGEALAYGVAEKAITEIYETEVLKSDEYEVLGQPVISALDFGFGKDLEATIRFGVRPEIELKDLSTIEVDKPKADVSDEDVEREVDRLRRRHADLIPLEEGEALGEDGMAVVDMQPLDKDTGESVGEPEIDVELMLDDDSVRDAFREALVGKKAGDMVRVEIDHDDHTHVYQVTINEAKRAELPELDEDFYSEASDEEFTDAESFRADIRQQLENAFGEAAREFVDGRVVQALLSAHDVPVPSSVVGIFLDSFVEDVKRQNDGELPESFDESAFRRANAPQAYEQGRWMLLRDKIVEELGIEVTEDERNAYIGDLFGRQGDMTPEMHMQMVQFMRSQPGMMEQMQQRMMSRKVFDAILERVTLREKDIEQIREEDEAKAKAAREAAEAQREAAADTITTDDIAFTPQDADAVVAPDSASNEATDEAEVSGGNESDAAETGETPAESDADATPETETKPTE
jgi:trigger factor